MSVGQMRAVRRRMKVQWSNKLHRKPRLFRGHTQSVKAKAKGKK